MQDFSAVWALRCNRRWGFLSAGFSSLRNIEKSILWPRDAVAAHEGCYGRWGKQSKGLAPKLESAFQEIVGVSIKGPDGELRSTYDLLSDLQKKWDSLTSSQQQYIGSLVSGNRQITVLTALMRNWSDVQSGVAAATNSAGSALLENEKYLAGIEGRMNTLSSAFTQLSQNTVDSNLIKFLVDLATALVNIVDKIGLVPTVLLGLTAFGKAFSDTGIVKNPVKIRRRCGKRCKRRYLNLGELPSYFKRQFPGFWRRRAKLA